MEQITFPGAESRTFNNKAPEIGIIMGSLSDWPTLGHAAEILESFEISYEKAVVSAHRTPDRLAQYGKRAKDRGLKIILAGAGGAAHLPGMTAAFCPLPVLGIPVESRTLKGMDSLLSIVQMPAGIPVPTFAIGKAGAINAALSAVAILAINNTELATKLDAYRENQAQKVVQTPFPKAES